MRDLFQGGSFAFRDEPFVVFGSKMSSEMGQNARQNRPKMARVKGDKLDFSEMLSKETVRLAAGRA